MTQDTTSAIIKNPDEDLKIEKCKFRYTKRESTSEKDGYYLGNNPFYDENSDYFKGVRERNPINEDYYISGLNQLLETSTLESSKRIWQQMTKVPNNCFTAIYVPNDRFRNYHKRTRFPSRFLHSLRNHAWIPDQKGNFHKPSEILLENVHHDFDLENDDYFFSRIGLLTNKDSDEKENAAEILGFTMDEVELFTKLKRVIYEGSRLKIWDDL